MSVVGSSRSGSGRVLQREDPHHPPSLAKRSASTAVRFSRGWWCGWAFPVGVRLYAAVG